MGPITQYLKQVIEKQVDDKGLVVWFDPEGYYREFVSTLKINGCEVVVHSRGYYRLRYATREKMRGDVPPRMVVYVQVAQDDTENALVEYTAFGVVLKPGQSPWQRNTRPSVVVKNALKDRVEKMALEDICSQVDAGKLSLDEIECMIQESDLATGSLVRAIFGTLVPEELALLFLSSISFDEDLIKRGALQQLGSILEAHYGLRVKDLKDIVTLRERFANHVLSTDLAQSAPNAIKTSSANSLLESREKRNACAHLTSTWRKRRDLSSSYADWANKVEQAVSIPLSDLDLDDLAGSETLKCTEARLIELVEAQLLEGTSEVAIETIKKKRNSFWYSNNPEIKLRWDICYYACEIKLLAKRIESEIKEVDLSIIQILTRYAEGEKPWCELDRVQRAYEQVLLDLPLDKYQSTKMLDVVVKRAYRQTVELLCKAMAASLISNGEDMGDKAQQHIFKNFVQPLLAENKTAYILVDALRYEMARDISKLFENDFSVKLSWSVGSLPSVTEIGMVAVLPKAEDGLGIADIGNGRIGASIGENMLSSREKRITHFKECTEWAEVMEMGDLLSETKRSSMNSLKECKVALITSREIDDLGEINSQVITRTHIEPILAELVKAVFKLSRLGFSNIVITSDHGFLMVPGLGEEMRMEPPTGKQVAIHKRAWIGIGGNPTPGNFKVKMSELGYISDLDLILPEGLGIFRAPAGEAIYFHGGPSPQEITTPVLVLKKKGFPCQMEKKKDSWTLTLKDNRIATAYNSVLITGKNLIFDVEPRLVSIELRDGDKVISKLVDAGGLQFDEPSGFFSMKQKEGSMEFEPTRVVLLFDPTTRSKTVSLVLTDVKTQSELARIDAIEVTYLPGLI